MHLSLAVEWVVYETLVLGQMKSRTTCVLSGLKKLIESIANRLTSPDYSVQCLGVKMNLQGEIGALDISRNPRFARKI